MNEDVYILVKKYLSGQLSEDERSDFEIKLENDSHFREQAELYSGMIEAITHKGDEELNAELMTLGKSLLQEEAPKEQKNVRKLQIPYYAYAIAAAILVLIIIVWPSKQATPEALFYSHFDAPYSEVRSGNKLDTKIDSLEQSWRFAYNDNDYDETVLVLSELLADSAYQNRSTAYYYLGISQLKLESTDLALDAFEKIDDGFEFQRELQWYKALAYLKKGNIVEAKKRFQEIVENPFFKEKKDLEWIYEGSQDILKELRN